MRCRYSYSFLHNTLLFNYCLIQEDVVNHSAVSTVHSKELQIIKFPFRCANSVKNGGVVTIADSVHCPC
jgi:hypothetical protein